MFQAIRPTIGVWIFASATLASLILLIWLFSPAAAVAVASGAALVGLLFVRWTLYWLLFLLLVVMAEIGLPNKIFSITLPNGNNLIGIRDVLILAVIGVGLYKGRGRLRETASNPLILAGLCLTALVPIAYVVGFFHGADMLIATREVFSLSCGWLLALAIGANFRHWPTVKRLLDVGVVLGILVAVGASIEILSANRLQIVSQFQEELFPGAYRNFPDGFVLMFFAWSVSGVFLLTRGLRTRYTVVELVVGLGTILTAKRGYLYSYIAAVFVLLVLAALARTTWIKAGPIVALGLLVFTAIGGTMYTVAKLSDQEVIGQGVERYANIAADAEGRLYELGMVSQQLIEHPLTGAGLGVKYRERLTLIVENAFAADERWNDTGTYVHNIMAFILLKTGPLGLLSFLVFIALVLRDTWRILKLRAIDERSTYRLAVYLLLVYSLIEAQSSNIFADPREMPIVAIVLGLSACLYPSKNNSGDANALRESSACA